MFKYIETSPHKVISLPSKDEFCKGIEEFEKHEKRDAMYKVATFLVSRFWGKPREMADSLGVLLLTWNQAFYRYWSFDFDKLEKCISDNLKKIESFRNRDISNLSKDDEKEIEDLFVKFLKALQIVTSKGKVRKSPVAVSKALHLLAPKFFPLWDIKIAQAYKCYYDKKPEEKYILFCKVIQIITDKVKDYTVCSDKSIVKLIDEYNYSKYTKKWI
jgi:hypothetical protein